MKLMAKNNISLWTLDGSDYKSNYNIAAVKVIGGISRITRDIEGKISLEMPRFDSTISYTSIDT